MNDFTVYKHINKINNKVYIGITSQNPKDRWNNGNGYIGCTRFYNAIKKYGWNNFKHVIIESGLTEEEAKSKEINLILKEEATNPEKGYNLRAGGDLPSETCCVKINCYDLNGKFIKTFESASQAATELGVDRNCLIQCYLLNPKHKKAGPYIFRKYEGNTCDLKNIKIKENYKKQVFVYDINGKEIMRFNSMSEASKNIGCSLSSLFDANRLNRPYKGKIIKVL